MVIKVKRYGDIPIYYRPGTTDENVIKEVIDGRAYRRAGIGFDVEEGEHWLDLGANIGAFAVYCKIRGATAECYEPEPGCFNLLQRNAKGFSTFCAAVSSSREPYLALSGSNKEGNYTRGTLLEQARSKYVQTVQNVYAGHITRPYDGVKMDIEGSEFGLIDDSLLPPCEKLCMEYHTSRDPSTENLKRRLEILKRKFHVVKYPPEFDRMIAKGGNQKAFCDRYVHCMEPI